MSVKQHSRFAKKMQRVGLGGTSVLALCAIAHAAPAAAQDSVSSGGIADEIIVTGIRSSLSASADRKRESMVILDSITSEDLGKFPDSNVAESLQRIPGVSIDRNGGEGQFVTVRGFGPQFNTVLVNGRTFASDNTGREFSFDLLAAELITGADVYKSSQASLQDGGIGATINIRTPRPLDIGGFKAVGSAKGVYEDNSDDVSPQLFGLVSTTFGGDTFGLMAAVSFQERDSLTNFTQNRGYIPGSTVGPVNAPLFTNVFSPRNQDVGSDTQNRERFGANVTAQYRPDANLTFTLDGLYNQFDVKSQVSSLGNWFEPSAFVDAEIDENRTITSLTTNGFADFISTSNNRFAKTRAVGFNTEWMATDQLKVMADVSWSRATDSAGGRNHFAVIGAPSQFSFEQAVDGGFPSVFGHTADLTDPSIGRTHIALRQGNSEAERILEYKLDTEWESDGGALDKVRFGGVHTRRKKNSQTIGTDPNTVCVFCGYNTSVTDPLLQAFSLGNFLGSSGTVPTNFQSFDSEAYFAFLESAGAAAALDTALGLTPGTTAARLAATNGFDAVVQPNSFRINENVYAGYIDADFRATLGGLPWFINIGARYVHTELTASGQQLDLIDLLPVPGDVTIFQGVFANGGQPLARTESSSYDFFLPNFNARVDLGADVVARMSASRTLTRPQVQDLAPRTNFDVLRPASLDASGGNPALKPYTSNNFDISLEWYPSRTTTIAVAAFYKNVRDFIVQTRESEVITIANAGNIPVGGLITGPNEATFSVRRPRNADTANVRGLEVNVVHTFDWLPGLLSGFGTQLNATFVGSNATFDQDSDSTSFALEGLGDSQNASVFYEKGGLSARVAYNRRERFLEHLVTPGQGGDPVFRRTFDQWDVRASYDVNQYAQVFVEGINITSEKNITTGRFDNQVLDFIDTGARWAVGFRGTF